MGSEDSTAEAPLEKLEQAGVRVYRNVLRKTDEQCLALDAIVRWSSPYLASNFLYALSKMDQGYRACPGNAERLKVHLLELKNPRQVNIYFEPHSRNALLWLLRSLKTRRAFDNGCNLARCSFRVILVGRDHHDGQHISNEIKEIKSSLREQDLFPRVIVDYQIMEQTQRLSTQQLRHELIAGRVDPIYIGGNTLAALLKSNSWKDREAAGLLLDAAARRDPVLYGELIIKKLSSVLDEEDWQKTCSVLNAISKFGRPRSEDLELMFERLRGFAEALNSALEREKRSPVQFDVVWRYMAAVHAVVHSVDELYSLLSLTNLEHYIASDPFLLRELFFYANRSAMPPAEALKALHHAFDVLEAHLPFLSPEDRKAVLLRITRLASLWESDGSTSACERLEQIAAEWPELAEQCQREAALCHDVTERGLTAFFSGTQEERARKFASYLFVRTTKSALARGEPRGLVSSLQTEFQQTLSPRFHPNEEMLSWRGDKTSLARLVLSEIPLREVYDYLRTMADDEDETIRWASLVLAMDFGLRQAILRENTTREDCLAERELIASVLKITLTDKCHYWLHREFLELFLREHGSSNPLPPEARLQVPDVPGARRLFFGPVGEMVHPEVTLQMREIRERFRRVTLVLPPIDCEPEAGSRLRATSTPPLGLGSVAAYLLSRGHDVQILDCHRYPEFVDCLVSLVKGQDVVGFNVVTSTFRSTRKLIWILRTNLGNDCPTIVLGGQAPTLHPDEFINDKTFQWDYLVLGYGEYPMVKIVERNSTDQFLPLEGIIERWRGRTQAQRYTLTSPQE